MLSPQDKNIQSNQNDTLDVDLFKESVKKTQICLKIMYT